MDDLQLYFGVSGCQLYKDPSERTLLCSGPCKLWKIFVAKLYLYDFIQWLVKCKKIPMHSAREKYNGDGDINVTLSTWLV